MLFAVPAQGFDVLVHEVVEFIRGHVRDRGAGEQACETHF